MDFIILGSSGAYLKNGGMFGLDVIVSFYRAYNVVFGLFQAPYYAFSQTMMAELSPPGFDNMVEKSFTVHYSQILIFQNIVFRIIWTFKPSIKYDRTECDPSYN